MRPRACASAAAWCSCKSETYNGGTAFMAPAPVAAYEWRRVTFNAVYFPKWRDVNRTNQLGFWLTVWID